MIKKVKKVIVSVIITASLVFLIFTNGSKISIPLSYFNFGKNAPQVQQHSPPTQQTKNNNTSPPSNNGSVGAEQTIKRETKQPTEKSVKDIHNEVSHEIKHNTMKFKINPEYKIKPIKPMIPKMGVGGKAKLIRVLVP